MITINLKLFKSYYLEINSLTKYRDFDDGITFADLELSLELYKNEHNPSLNFSLIFLNYSILGISIYKYVETEKPLNRNYVKCSRCKTEVQSTVYETGEEQYCQCQSTLDADFAPKLWEWNL